MQTALAALALTACEAAQLTYPVELNAADGWHNLSIQYVNFLDWGFQTRGWNGGIPGPTFRTKPGETIQINFINDLNPANSKTCPQTEVEFCESEVSNLHTHGLHVSAQSTVDGLPHNSDDIFVFVEPGTATTYEFAIPADHAPGMHWYHPHHHHATALQAGGGAAGVIIVDDPPGFLPTEYATMKEFILVISCHNLDTLQDLAVQSQTPVMANAADRAKENNHPTTAWLVNGMEKPELTITGGRWHRLRMVFAAVKLVWKMEVDDGPATCELQLLAKDGIYLNTIPRQVQHIPLYPGARADVAIRCTCPTYPCRQASGAQANDNDVFTINIVGPSSGSPKAADLTPFDMRLGGRRPCYLADLQRAAVPAANTGDLTLDDAKKITWNGKGVGMTYANTHLPGKTIRDFPPITTLQTGNVYEAQVFGTTQHPMHQHVNPYQITWMLTSQHSGYFQVGDWHDTLQLPGHGIGPIKVRFQTDVFVGKQVVHCHRLKHEDLGMMGFFDIAGVEGAKYTCATSLEERCYRGLFDPSVTTWTPNVDAACIGAGSSMPAKLKSNLRLLFVGIAVALGLIIGGGGYFAYRHWSGDKDDAPPAPSMRDEAENVELANLRQEQS